MVPPGVVEPSRPCVESLRGKGRPWQRAGRRGTCGGCVAFNLLVPRIANCHALLACSCRVEDGIRVEDKVSRLSKDCHTSVIVLSPVLNHVLQYGSFGATTEWEATHC